MFGWWVAAASCVGLGCISVALVIGVVDSRFWVDVICGFLWVGVVYVDCLVV